MLKRELFSKLKEGFGLSNRHISILQALEGRELTANQICKTVSIPQGRIYTYLNELVKVTLVNRSNRKPHLYGVPTLKKNIMRFIKHRMDKMIKHQTEVMDMMKGETNEFIEFIERRIRYTRNHLHQIAEGKSMRIICLNGSFPFALYPYQWDDFITLRKLVSAKRRTLSFTDNETALMIHKAYRDAFKQKKPFHLLFQESTWKYHTQLIERELGKPFLRRMVKNITENIQDGVLNAFLTKEIQLMELDINEKRVCLAMRHLDMTSGIIIHSQNVVQLYHKYFEQKCAQATPLIDFLI